MIVSHHGKLEFGSPKVPVFPEALLLHYLDDMDSKMEAMRGLIDKDPLAEGDFTSYSPSLERVALRKERYLAPPTQESTTTNTMKETSEAAPPPPNSVNSVFGSKLQLALGDDRE
jgi:3'-5' exoribonuclease